MGKWILMIVMGVCAAFCFYMAFLGNRVADNGAWFFAACGVLFTTIFISLVLNRKAKKDPEADRSVQFVPHCFLIVALTLILIGITGAILIQMILP